MAHVMPSLLLTLEEISQLVSGRDNPAETLTNIVNLIAQRCATDVCSVYLLAADRLTLVLTATRTKIVNLSARRSSTGFCSFCLLEAGRLTLVVAATVGLRPEGVGQVR